MSDRHQIAPYPIRMPGNLRTALEREAKASGRSLHAEIIQRLQASFTKRDLIRSALGLPAEAPESDQPEHPEQSKLLREAMTYARLLEESLQQLAEKDGPATKKRAAKKSAQQKDFDPEKYKNNPEAGSW